MTGSPDRPRPVRAALRRRMMARAGLVAPELAPQSIDVGGMRRSFVAVPGPGPDVPLLLVLHGAGGTGLGTAALSGLAERGPAAGCAVAFPDGFLHVWNDRRHAPFLARREGIDDVAFLQALVEHLRPGGPVAAPCTPSGCPTGGSWRSTWPATACWTWRAWCSSPRAPPRHPGRTGRGRHHCGRCGSSPSTGRPTPWWPTGAGRSDHWAGCPEGARPAPGGG